MSKNVKIAFKKSLIIIRAEVVKILLFQLCAMSQNKISTYNMLHYEATQKSIALYD